jgi:hypothetical protein
MLGEMCLRKEGVRKVSTVDVTKLRVSTKIGKYMWSNVGEQICVRLRERRDIGSVFYAIPWLEIMLPEQSTVPYQKTVKNVPD